MDTKNIEYLESCFDFASEVFFLREIWNDFRDKGSEKFTFDLKKTWFIDREEGIGFLKNLDAEKVIKIFNSDALSVKPREWIIDDEDQAPIPIYDEYFEVQILQDFDEFYKNKLEEMRVSIAESLDAMNVENQSRIICDAITKKKNFLGKDQFLFDFEDIPSDQKFHISFYFVLLYLEMIGFLKIEEISLRDNLKAYPIIISVLNTLKPDAASEKPKLKKSNFDEDILLHQECNCHFLYIRNKKGFISYYKNGDQEPTMIELDSAISDLLYFLYYRTKNSSIGEYFSEQFIKDTCPHFQKLILKTLQNARSILNNIHKDTSFPKLLVDNGFSEVRLNAELSCFKKGFPKS